MSWKEDAAKEAAQELQNEENEKIRKIEAEKEARNQEHDRKMDNFHNHTNSARREIEKVLSKAREEGLIVSEAREGWFSWQTKVGHYYETSHSGTGWADDKVYYEYFAICWDVTDPESDSELSVFLGLKEIETKNWLNKISISYSPTNSAYEVEIDIKRFLKEKYKRK